MGKRLGLLLVVAWSAQGAWAQSAALLEAVRLHRPEARRLAEEELRACQARQCAQAGRLALLAGALALSEGEAPQARALLEDARVEPLLLPYLAWYQGQARFYSGDSEAAAEAFGRALKGAPPALAERTRARLGEALLAAGRTQEAAPVLEKAAEELPGPELLYQRAVARGAQGQATKEREDLRAVAVRWPAHPYADEALARLAALKPPVRLSLAEHLKRARGLLGAGEAQRVLEELEQAEQRKLVQGTARAEVALLRAQALFARGRAAEAEAALAVARKGPANVAAEAALVLARRALRADDHESARAQMVALERTWPTAPAAEEAGFFVGWMDLQDGKFASAVKALQQYEERYPGSRRLDDALWFRALAHLRLEQYAQAREVLERLVEGWPRSQLVPQARYWAARSRELEKAKAEELVPAYEAVVSLAPNSYYALLASARLRELGREPPVGFPQPPRVLEESGRPPELALAVALTEAGLFREATEEVEAQAGRIRNPRQALSFTHALLALGEYGQAYAVGARLLWGKAFGAREPEALAVFYPRAYAGEVQAQAARHEVSPHLVWAIMRRESAFRPEVASSADARGLMQVIPKTARAIAERLSEPAPAPGDLFSPERSIRYGSWYLGALRKRFGHPALVAAAYNAGPSAVVKWVREKGSLPLDLFVEEIPFKETRGYVKQVVADLYLYHSFYGGKPEPLSLAIPAPSDEGVSF